MGRDAGIHSASNTLQKSMQRSSSKRSSTADSPCSASSAWPPRHQATTSASLRTSVTLSPAQSSFPRQASTSQRASRRPPLPPLHRVSLPVSAWRVSRRRETFPIFPLVLLAGAGYDSFEDEISFVLSSFAEVCDS